MEVAKADSGATKAERETARSIANRIMKAHGLIESDIPERTVEVGPYIIPMHPASSPVFVVNIRGGFGGFQWDFDNPNSTTNSF